MNIDPAILTTNIQELPFSEQLKNVLQSAGIEHLKQLLKKNVGSWPKEIDGFTYHHQFEVLNYLQKNELMSYLKES
jgi:hypothetical protein